MVKQKKTCKCGAHAMYTYPWMLYINLHSSAKQDIRIKLVTATSKSQNLDGSAQDGLRGSGASKPSLFSGGRLEADSREDFHGPGHSI